MSDSGHGPSEQGSPLPGNADKSLTIARFVPQGPSNRPITVGKVHLAVSIVRLGTIPSTAFRLRLSLAQQQAGPQRAKRPPQCWRSTANAGGRNMQPRRRRSLRPCSAFGQILLSITRQERAERSPIYCLSQLPLSPPPGPGAALSALFFGRAGRVFPHGVLQ